MREWGKLKKGTPVVRVDGVNWKKEHPSYA